jgi:Proteasome maturation factor UMP1
MDSKTEMQKKIYGLHMPLKLHMEQHIVAQFRRLPGGSLKSSFVGLETLMGTDTTIDFADYLDGMCFFFFLSFLCCVCVCCLVETMLHDDDTRKNLFYMRLLKPIMLSNLSNPFS